MSPQREEKLIDYPTPRAWAHDSDFQRDFEGREKYLGIAAQKWPMMRLGVETVKPDVHLHNFVEPIVGHPVTDAELVGTLETVASRLALRPKQLDASLWEFLRAGPGAV